MERETGIEPATSSLGSWHSTAELLPLVDRIRTSLKCLDLMRWNAVSKVSKVCRFPYGLVEKRTVKWTVCQPENVLLALRNLNVLRTGRAYHITLRVALSGRWHPTESSARDGPMLRSPVWTLKGHTRFQALRRFGESGEGHRGSKKKPSKKVVCAWEVRRGRARAVSVREVF
jgi:hypothetical protein